MPSTRDIRRRIKSVREHPPDHQGDGAGGCVEDEEGAAGGARRPALRAAARRHARRRSRRGPRSRTIRSSCSAPVRTRGIILVTTDKGLCGPLNANLFKLVVEIKEPAKFAVDRPQGRAVPRPHPPRPAGRFPGQRPRPVRAGQAGRRVHGEQYLAGVVDTVEIIWPRFRNTLIQEPTRLPLLPLAEPAGGRRQPASTPAGGAAETRRALHALRAQSHGRVRGAAARST